jgi:DNA-binding winged helix-turn-helix (wHTH) protein
LEPVRYRFGEVELDAATYVLRRGGQEVALQPKVFDVLRYLIEHRERLVSKTELLEAVWRGDHVNESAVPWSISHARTALGQERGSKSPIETVHGRGYRFVAAVETLASQPPASAAPPPMPVASARSQGGPFVGRADVMQRLRERLSEALQGHGHLCLLYGEAGMGKTRCAEELMLEAERLGASAWSGRSVEDAGEPVFWPWMQILREAVRDRPDMRTLGEPLLARLAALPDDASAAEEGRDESANRFWLLDEVTRLLLQAAQSTPIVLLLDDMQWADAGTLNLLSFLAPELAGSRVLVLATRREEPVGEGERRWTRLLRHAERIELARLTVEDVHRYLGELASPEEPPLSLARAVHKATAGNPLFVQETVRALVVEHGEEALATLVPSAIKLPEVARDVLRRPLEALGEEARRALAAGSVLGETFELPLLHTLTELPLPRLLEHVEAASKLGLIVAETPQRYRFSHSLVRELVYDAVPTPSRVAFHRAAAEALETLHAVEPRYNEIAQHYYRSLPAGGYERVAGAARKAAQAAEAVLAHSDAARFYEWALEAQALDPGVGPRDRAELLFALGRALRNAGRDNASRNALGRLFELARQHGYSDLLLRGARALRPTVAMAGVPDPLVRDALEEVLRIAPEGPHPQRILAMSQLVSVPPYARDMARVKQMSERALGLARELGQRWPLFEALRARLYALSGPDDTSVLLEVAAEILELDRSRLSAVSSEAHCARYAALLYCGKTKAAEEVLAAIGQLAALLRLPEVAWYHDRQAAQQRLLEGDLSGAEAAAADLIARSARLGLGYGPWFVDTLRAHITGERAGIAALRASQAGQAVPIETPYFPPSMRARLLRNAVWAGRREVATAALDNLAARGFDAIPKDIAYLGTLADLAVASLELGDLARAEQIYALLAPYASHNTPEPMLYDQGSASRYLGLLAASLGKHDRVEAHYRDALSMNRAMKRPGYVARTCCDYARWLSQRGEAGASARARELAQEGLALADSMGMSWLAEQARELAK